MKLKGVTTDIHFDDHSFNGHVDFSVSAVDTFSNSTTPTVVTKATWTPVAGLQLTGRFLLPNSFSDLENRTIRIGSKEVRHLKHVP